MLPTFPKVLSKERGAAPPDHGETQFNAFRPMIHLSVPPVLSVTIHDEAVDHSLITALTSEGL
jgi:hypothetical protein